MWDAVGEVMANQSQTYTSAGSLLLVIKTHEAVSLALALLLLAEGLHRTTRKLLVEIGDVCVGGEDGHKGGLY